MKTLLESLTTTPSQNLVELGKINFLSSLLFLSNSFRAGTHRTQIYGREKMKAEALDFRMSPKSNGESEVEVTELQSFIFDCSFKSLGYERVKDNVL